MAVVLLLNLGLVTALAAVGLAAHSLAVFVAGADYLADAGALGVSPPGIWLASRSRGYPNATTIAAAAMSAGPQGFPSGGPATQGPAADRVRAPGSCTGTCCVASRRIYETMRYWETAGLRSHHPHYRSSWRRHRQAL
jgi:hypothetical protein